MRYIDAEKPIVKKRKEYDEVRVRELMKLTKKQLIQMILKRERP